MWEIELIYKLDELRNKLPLRVIAGINGLKRLGLFNAYSAYQAVDKNQSPYTVVTGILWNIWENKGKDERTYFIARY